MVYINKHMSDSGKQRRIKYMIYSIDNGLFKTEDTEIFFSKTNLPYTISDLIFLRLGLIWFIWG